ncbi:MAG: bL17 family ribosomal protein [Phycisphaerales bacterium]
MRHRRAGYRLGRTSTHRLAMLRNMACGLFEHGQIVTTVPKAKCLQPFVEKIITLAKRGDLAARRRVIAILGGDRLGFDWLYVPRDANEQEKAHVEDLRERAKGFFDLPDSSEVERNRYGEIRKSPKVVKHIFSRVAGRFQDRTGGYTRIVKLAKFRIGDASPLCVLQFVGNSENEGPEIGGRVSVRRKKADKRTAFAAKLRKEKEAAGA